MHTERLVVGYEYSLCRVSPRGHLLRSDTQLLGTVRTALCGLGRREEVLLGHEVGVDVVVGDSTVLVWAGNAIDAEVIVSVVVAQREPEPSGLDEQFQASFALERIVGCRGSVA